MFAIFRYFKNKKAVIWLFIGAMNILFMQYLLYSHSKQKIESVESQPVDIMLKAAMENVTGRHEALTPGIGSGVRNHNHEQHLEIHQARYPQYIEDDVFWSKYALQTVPKGSTFDLTPLTEYSPPTGQLEMNKN